MAKTAPTANVSLPPPRLLPANMLPIMLPPIKLDIGRPLDASTTSPSLKTNQDRSIASKTLETTLSGPPACNRLECDAREQQAAATCELTLPYRGTEYRGRGA
jgi:hypothetical protein